MQRRSGHARLRQQRKSQKKSGPQEKCDGAECDDGTDLFRAEAQSGIGSVANRPAAQRVQAHVVADGVTHERYQGNARVRHARTGKAHGERVVQSQAAVAGERKQPRPQQFHGRDGVDVAEDIPPPILAEQMMQPQQRQPEQGNA